MALTLDTDPAAVDAADLAGPPQRFHAVVDRHFDAVAAFLARRVGPDTAQDLTQEVFVTAFRKRAKFKAEYGSARPWLFGIANKAVASHRREERRQLELLQRAVALPEPVLAPADGLDPELYAGLTALARRDRDALLLHAWGELSYDEIAHALDVPVGTVRSRIHRARRQLTAHLGGAR
ncbi:RNA polymerase sigma factor [Solirubrobacter sp. CPCC 204708]|uniref:RNA polymerase sigma factor n=1 Tax=Solirubrobacter deserti TaxID=2282478 RepID=A0ABT4RDH9_9ACTN|nr:RNA polymerase sigma factor [Solirubrobacter deserti]MBE2314569.1 RNA polymerase sigma factor [Solirubrobacter deserti]MDA0136573.1 RNA polymerase sigma factor [Solirubrobacter deserti]